MNIVPFAPGSGPDARPDPPRTDASRFTLPAAQQNACIHGGMSSPRREYPVRSFRPPLSFRAQREIFPSRPGGTKDFSSLRSSK